MHVRDLPVSATVREQYRASGIEELYPPQAAAVEAGVTRGENVVAAIPTASGKTLIAELAMLTADGPALYIVPLRALAREKYESFAALPGVSVGISTGDFDSPAEALGEEDVVVATAEKVDSAIRNGASWVEALACVVVDEVHLLGRARRGPTLEITLATLQRRAPGVQIVALSATVDNPDAIAAWLDAELVESTWRPVSLRRGVYVDGDVDFDDGSTLAVDAPPPGPAGDRDTEVTAALVADTVDDGGQCLAFVRSRREAESLAARLAEEPALRDRYGDSGDADPEGSHDTDPPGPRLAERVRERGGTETGRRLAAAVESGVGFHHAGLASDHRALVESAYRDRTLGVICATPTLAAGVNVPARRVVVRDLERYTGEEMTPLPTLEVHQMCGRAGRPHLDPYGEAILVAADPAAVRERYVDAGPEAIESQLTEREALRTHVLSVVASGFADSKRGVLNLLDATFFAFQSPDVDLSGLVDGVAATLSEMGLLAVGGATNAEGATADTGTLGGALSATDLGATVSRQYVRPETGARLVDAIRTIESMSDENVTPLTALGAVCATPDTRGTYLGNRERAAIYRYATRHAAEFTTAPDEADDFESWLCAVKLARILLEWTQGADREALVDQYRIGPGDLESHVERATWLLGAADALADTLNAETSVFEAAREELDASADADAERRRRP
ncbi:DEAD/DEAH box helicase [Halobellus salinus]|uniref:ATP-dependent DNA helicase Hel308 n=1 Tax=Halobellus salinus TaxID=931585 RepID=A0A830ERD0_9EURY|nr:DEAD/DEAH box helicase [Halobellus salinus]GGJ16329.1 DEAD/DEAH box helicase [Halobellus salinus]SMP30401.1 helicase [Halobellus salinus]